MLKSCVLVGWDWAKPMMFLLFHVTCSCIFHAYILLFSFFLILSLIGTLLRLSLSLSFFRILYAWHPSAKLLRLETLFVPRHPFLLILPLYMSSAVMRRPVGISRRTFLGVAFIRNAMSSFRIFSILTYPLSSTVGVGNPFVTSRSAVPP